jgi:hypothetical protein
MSLVFPIPVMNRMVTARHHRLNANTSRREIQTAGFASSRQPRTVAAFRRRKSDSPARADAARLRVGAVCRFNAIHARKPSLGGIRKIFRHVFID